jgi:hypothetical protein
VKLVRRIVQHWGIIGLLVGAGIGCGGENPIPPAEQTLYERVETIIAASCSSGYCHGGPGTGAANINFERMISLGQPFSAALLSDNGDLLPSCQYDRMPLLTPGNSSESWLMVKVDAAHNEMGQIDFTPAADWDPGIVPDGDGQYPPSACPLTEDGAIVFGLIMPYTAVGPALLSSPDREAIRAWIDAGAPVPE